MKSLAFVLLLAFALCSCKEDLEQLEQLLKNPEIIDLVKRLGLLEDESSDLSSDGITNEVSTDAKPSDSDDRSCSKKNESSTIIQTKISLNNGAVFLGSQHGVSDVKHCAQMCCETDDCDVSVYQDKDKRACYLFNCKDDKTEVNRCEFSTHKDYYSIFVTKVRADASKGQDTPEENDLSDLHLHIPDKQNPTTTTVKPTTVFYHPHSVGNGGACVEDLNCEDIHAECRARTCQCRSGFYEKRGQCRKVCGSSEFECVEPGTAVTGPDCIPKSQFCDGQTQCGDGSDEINCPTTGHSSSNAVDSHKETPKVPQGNNKENSDSSPTNTGTGKTHPTEQDGGPAAGSDENLKPQTAAPQIDKGKGGKAPDAVPASGVDKVKPASSNVSSTAGVDKHPSPNDSKGSDEDKGRSGKGGSEPSLGKPKGSASVDSSAATPSHAGSGLEGIQSESAVFVERVAPTDLYSTKGPIIALSLGLCFTVILLIFAGCRLRTIRRRLRKGRPLHSNEADYLINGMYL